MNPQRLSPQEAAHQIWKERFPEAKVIFLAGSVIRGEATPHSDLDLVVIYDKLPTALRESFIYKDWPVEAFVHDPETLNYFFWELDRISGVPSLPSTVLEGIEIPNATPLSQSLKALALKVIETGPPKWTDSDIQRARYAITDLCDDIRSPRNPEELAGSASRLYDLIADFYFRSRQKWSAKGKSIPRRLNGMDPQFAEQFNVAFKNLFSSHDPSQVIELTEKMLSSHEGFLFADYKLEAPKEWRRSLDEKSPDPLGNSVFSKIIRGELPSYKVFENDHVLAFLARDAIHLGHTLVIPKIEVDYFIDVPEPYYSAVFSAAKQLSRAIHKVTGCKRVGTITAGWDVPHFHYHLVPMFDYYDLDPKRAQQRSPEESAEIQKKIIEALNA